MIKRAVITTIQPPTSCVRTLIRKLDSEEWRLIVIGDRKGPASYELDGATFHDLQAQLKDSLSLASLLPEGHYARKNLGYLYAMRDTADLIYETDDDNYPVELWSAADPKLSGCRIVPAAERRWVNVYAYFTDEKVWPRGFPLEELQRQVPETVAGHNAVTAPIQQALVNRAPDVDAVWRLTDNRPLTFEDRAPVLFEPGNWCPFNTQNTWWFPQAYALLYIPSHCSFRMCDIWKSFVAQRCLWATGSGIAFLPADAVQERNEHNLLRDFQDEIPGYLGNDKLSLILSELDLSSASDAVPSNLLACYEALVSHGFFPKEEMRLVEAWIHDLENL
jgi:hypothetical protein